MTERGGAIGHARRLSGLILLVAVAALASWPARGALGNDGTPADFTPVAGMRSFREAPGIHEWRFGAPRGPSPFDRIGLERVARGKTPAVNPLAVVLYLPGTFMNGAVAVDDPRYSMPLFMAGRGVDFWSLDYRTHFVPPAATQAQLGAMAGWTDAVFLADVESAARFVETATGQPRIYVAGFSRGAEFAYLFAARHPEEVAGVIILDGTMPSAALRGNPPPGRYADDVSGRRLTWARREALMRAVIEHPDGPAPTPQFATARANLEHVVYAADGFFGGHGGLANPLGGFSDAVVLARTMAAYDRYWPAVQDYEDPFNAGTRSALLAARLPVLAFASTNIGPHWSQNVAASARAAAGDGATVVTLDGWGHLDVICGTHAAAEVFTPTLGWIRQRQAN
jgi:dienelactone hydrolase